MHESYMIALEQEIHRKDFTSDILCERYLQAFDQSKQAGDVLMKERETRSELQEYWLKSLAYPDWYIRLQGFLQNWLWNYVHEDERVKTIRVPFYDLVGDMLEKNQIPLADYGPDFDLNRKKRRLNLKEGEFLVDTVVIHHSEGDPKPTLDAEVRNLNAIGFIRQYAHAYAEDSELRGRPIWTPHYSQEGKPVFAAYNAGVAPSGEIGWLLKDRNRAYTLWHAGGEMNTRSAAIVAVGNYEHAKPPLSQIEGIARAIQDNYSEIPFDTDHIRGHREVTPAGVVRTCPGEFFLGQNGWKNTLLSRLQQNMNAR